MRPNVDMAQVQVQPPKTGCLNEPCAENLTVHILPPPSKTMTHKREVQLLTSIANDLDDARPPMSHDWLVANHVTLDEANAICTILGYVIRGITRAPKDQRNAIILYGIAEPFEEDKPASTRSKACAQKISK